MVELAYTKSAFTLGMHPEVDNEEGSTTICLYKSMPYKIYGIMHNLCNIKTTQRILPGKHQKNWSMKCFISIPRTALYDAGN